MRIPTFILMKRLFVAIHITPSKEFLALLENLRAGLRFASITWVKPDNIHVTLKFFGETEERMIPEINRVMSLAASLHRPFGFSLKDIGIFGSTYQPKVIWVGMENAEALSALALNVLEAAEQIGWERDRQNFVPHLTLGRVKNVPDKRLFQHVIDEHRGNMVQEVLVKEFHLYESILRKEGPVYNILETYKL